MLTVDITQPFDTTKTSNQPSPPPPFLISAPPSTAMNTTLSPDSAVGMFSSDRIGGLGYGIAVSVGLLLLITTITLASYHCTRVNTSPYPPDAARRHRHRLHWPADDGPASVDIESGIDEATLTSYPKLLYSKAKKEKAAAATAAACCSICLADYKDRDELRQLPECGHVFHVKCVDPWLRLHPTCPLCRTSPLPTPLPTPLAEVVPLAASRQS